MEDKKRGGRKLPAENKRGDKLTGAVKSAEFFKSLFSHIGDVAFQLSPLGIIEYVSPSVSRYGYTPKELIGHHLKKTTPLSELPRALKAISTILKGNELKGLEIRQTEKSGRIRTMELNAVPLMSGRKVVGIQGVFRDLEEVMQGREEERRRMVLEKAILANSAEMVIILDTGGEVTYVSPSVELIVGYKPEQVLGKRVFDFIRKEEQTEAHKFFLNSLGIRGSTGIFYVEVHHHNGGLRTLEVLGNNQVHNTDIDGFIFTARDATEKKRVEREMIKLSNAVTHSPASVVITDAEARIEYVNPKFTEVTGYGREEVMGKNPRCLKSGKTPASLYEELWATLLAGKTWRGEFCNKKKNGDIFWESVSISPLLDDDGRITHYIAVKEDISGKKKMEEELRSIEKRNSAILRAIPDLMFVIGKDGVFQDYHANDLSLLAKKPEEFLGKKLNEVFPQDFAKKVMQRVRKTLKTGAMQILEYEMPVMSGEMRSFEARFTRIGNESALLMVSDITERKEQEAALQLSDSILKAVDSIVLVTDVHGDIIFCSPSVKHKLGYEPEDLLGRGWWNKTFDNKKASAEVRKHIASCAAGDTPLDIAPYERQLRCGDGSQIWLLWHNSRGPDNTLIGVGHDITARKKAEEELQKEQAFSDAILSTMPDGVDIVDMQGNIIYMNKTLRDLFGAESIGKKCYKVYKNAATLCANCPLRDG
ncbi:MAG: PAS domain-containing protein, partial [Flavobacteriales bacterium]